MSANPQHNLPDAEPEWEALRQAMLASNARLPAPSPLIFQRALERINSPLVAPATVPPVASATVPTRGAAELQNDGWQTHPLAGLLLLIRRQLPLIGQSIWAASAVVLGMGLIVASLFPRAASPGPDVLALIAPIVTAVGIALLYGPEHDPATELECATPTSPALILLARLVLVYGYDLLLTLATSVVLWLLIGHSTLAGLILSWLAPMLFLSALALALSVLWNSQGAIVIAFSLWGLRVLVLTQARGIAENFAGFSTALWSNQGVLLILAAVCAGLAFIWVARQEQRYA